MSSTRSTVRSAVLNGVFSGTRSMPNLISVIFMRVFDLWLGRERRSAAAQADDAGDAVHVAVAVVEHQRQQRGDGHGVELERAHLAVAAVHAAAVGVVDDVGPAVDV